MATVTIKVRGVSDFSKANATMLANLIVGTEAALDTVSEATLELAQEVVPVGTPQSTKKRNYKGGTLKKSLQIYKERLRRQVGTDLYYGPFVHEGTYKMKARPFLTNSFEAKKSMLIQACQQIKVV